MKLSAWQRIDLVARQISPFAIAVLLLLAGAVPVPIPAYAAIAPSFVLMSVYFWTIHRPDLMPAPAVFTLGLVQDLLGGGPPGASAIVFLGLRSALLSQRRLFVGATFLMVWFGFLVAAAGATAASWTLASLFAGQMLALSPAVFQFFLSVGLYPTFGWMFVRVQRAFLRFA